MGYRVNFKYWNNTVCVTKYYFFTGYELQTPVIFEKLICFIQENNAFDMTYI